MNVIYDQATFHTDEQADELLKHYLTLIEKCIVEVQWNELLQYR